MNERPVFGSTMLLNAEDVVKVRRFLTSRNNLNRVSHTCARWSIASAQLFLHNGRPSFIRRQQE